MASKVDLQLHSCYSNKPDGWVLRRIGVPESYTRPEELYRKLKNAGMDFVTITDRNRIDGCLEIAHYPDVFISEQSTTYLPDGCKVHVLVWNITEKQHHEIQSVRDDIFAFTGYLNAEKIAHGVSHPLVSVNDRMTADNFEKLLLLFRVFESINGTRGELSGSILRQVIDTLTPEKIEALEKKHGFKSPLAEPWRKSLTAGSDDHSGLIPARAWTECPDSGSPSEFLSHVMEGHCQALGQPGTSMLLSHSLYTTAFKFYNDRIAKSSKGAASTSHLVGLMFSKFLAGKNPTRFSFTEKIGIGMDWLSAKIGGGGGSAYEISIANELNEIFGRKDFQNSLESAIGSEQEVERQAFQVATHLTNQLGYIFFKKFIDKVNSGNFIDSWQALTAIAPLGALLAPYIVSMREQHKDLPSQREIARRHLPELPATLRNLHRGWFTDTIEDVNGVATTIRTMVKQAVATGCDLEVVTSRMTLAFQDIPIKNFPPVGEFEIPEYELQKLSFPPVLNVADYCEQRGFTELIISTPGPIGVSALLAAKLLGLRTAGIYHTDFPQYVKILSDDDVGMESLCWQYMFWFYDQMDVVWVNSGHYRDQWIRRGINPEKIRILPRGIDTESYHPRRRQSAFWDRHGLSGKTVFLYVGRVSKEKNLDVLMDAWARLEHLRGQMALAIVGDGPYRAELQERFPDVVFTGYLGGEDLWNAYASGDCFVFPSTTDTFGNVILEAHASGLPTIVSDIGGPKELVEEGCNGFITRAFDAEQIARRMEQIAHDPALARKMSAQARSHVEERSWAGAFKNFWEATL
ncbi:glycosyltransferase [Kamptonema cortianum]|nr:glycosyltransferase [Oscillatoria laete-virens]MDK3160273.1 glycosyltransferase [Kamptonema cortianum]MDL5048376.1 glycosyltransferase [Oscillatoria amoena NRMC-F 0135]MDL5054259.1 glycosyltransferase [Oscillatoria laete-virens NRMC-F 0139]